MLSSMVSITGWEQKRDADVLCYQIRQSFKLGEVTPEQANAIGYDMALRWTKGRHAFFVATHIDRSHMKDASFSLCLHTARRVSRRTSTGSRNLTRFKTLLHDASRGHYGRDNTILFCDAARGFIGSKMPAKSLELRNTIKLIRELGAEIDEIETATKVIMDEIASPILTVPGISYRMGAMIIAEIGDFDMFTSPGNVLAYAVLSRVSRASHLSSFVFEERGNASHKKQLQKDSSGLMAGAALCFSDAAHK